MKEIKNLAGKKLAVVTVGCRLNQADTGLITSRLESAGCVMIDPKTCPPDIIIVNSCTVTSSASQRSYQTARSLRDKFPESMIVATGCSCVMEKEKWESEAAVDLVIGNSGKPDIAELVLAVLAGKKCSMPEKAPSPLFEERTNASFPLRSRAFLKIQDGCDARCSYCIVPDTRGPERSRKKDEVLREFSHFIEKGFKEIVITGVNICAYRDGKCTPSDILAELCGLPGEFRIRLGSMEPHPETWKLLDIMKSNSRICRFLHLPIQHGSDKILQAMNRKYPAAEFAKFARTAAEEIPGIHIGTDIIAGFPGETEELFLESCQLLESLPLANLHIFRFSPRKGTPAANFADKVPQKISKRRAEILAEVECRLAEKFVASQIGKVLPVLIEKTGATGKTGAVSSGWSDNYIKVFVNSPGIKRRSLVNVLATDRAERFSLVGVIGRD